MIDGWLFTKIVAALVLVALALLGAATTRVQRPKITDPAQYAAVLEEIEQLIELDPPAGSEEARRLEWLNDLAWEYDATLTPMPTT